MSSDRKLTPEEKKYQEMRNKHREAITTKLTALVNERAFVDIDTLDLKLRASRDTRNNRYDAYSHKKDSPLLTETEFKEVVLPLTSQLENNDLFQSGVGHYYLGLLRTLIEKRSHLDMQGERMSSSHFKRALKQFTADEKQNPNDPIIPLHLAHMYEQGYGVPKDQEKANQLYLLAIANKLPPKYLIHVEIKLGNYFLTKQNPPSAISVHAISHYAQAAKQGDRNSYHTLYGQFQKLRLAYQPHNLALELNNLAQHPAAIYDIARGMYGYHLVTNPPGAYEKDKPLSRYEYPRVDIQRQDHLFATDIVERAFNGLALYNPKKFDALVKVEDWDIIKNLLYPNVRALVYKRVINPQDSQMLSTVTPLPRDILSIVSDYRLFPASPAQSSNDQELLSAKEIKGLLQPLQTYAESRHISTHHQPHAVALLTLIEPNVVNVTRQDLLTLLDNSLNTINRIMGTAERVEESKAKSTFKTIIADLRRKLIAQEHRPDAPSP